jgi:hypothetical protein
MARTKSVRLSYAQCDAIVKAMKRANLHGDTRDIRNFWRVLNKIRDARAELELASTLQKRIDTPGSAAAIFAEGVAQ